MVEALKVIVDEMRGLGESFFRLVKAEIELVLEMWKRSLIELGKGLAFLGAAAYIFLLCVPALLIFAAVDGLAQWRGWPHWQAALVVVSAAFLVALVLAMIARRIFARRFESPAVLLTRRLDDHRGWWHERVHYVEKRLPAGAAGRGELDDDFSR